MSYDVWSKFEKFAKKLREIGYYVELVRTDDEIFERYIITIEKDKTKKGEYIG